MQGIAVRGEHIRALRKRTQTVSETNHPHTPAVQLQRVAHSLHAKLFRVQLVDDDRIVLLQIGDIAFNQIPRRTLARCQVETDHADTFGTTAGFLPETELRHQLVDAGHTRHRERFVTTALVEAAGDVDVGRAQRCHPQIRTGVFDQARCGARETNQQAKLHAHQQHGKNNANQGDHEARAIVGKVAPGQQTGAVAEDGERVDHRAIVPEPLR